MKMRREKKARKFGYFLAELFILVLGITASFALNEWRVNTQESKQQVQLLSNFKKNLVVDSTILSAGVKQLTLQLESANKILSTPTITYTDSLIISVLSLLNYVPFKSNDITYEEMKNLGNSRIIQNDSLLSSIIGLYENGYETVSTWAQIDGEHIELELIPYVEKNFPFVRGLNYPMADSKTKRDLMSAINQDEFKHLIQFGAAYKGSTKLVYSEALKDIKQLLVMIDSTLASN